MADVDLDGAIDILFNASASLAGVSLDLDGNLAVQFAASAMLSVYVPPIPPPSGMAMGVIRRVSFIMPEPELNDYGVPV